MVVIGTPGVDEVTAAQVLTAWLEGFTVPADIRSALGKLKVKGSPHSASRCPLANGARRQLSRKHLGSLIIMVGTTGLTIVHRHGGVTRIRLPRPAQEFVMNFDTGLYPELDDGMGA